MYICRVKTFSKLINTVFILAVSVFASKAQAPTNQDCPNAIPICNTTYSTVISYSGTGNIPNEINSGNSCLLSGEMHDVWYTFTTPFFGNLNFTITPNNPADDYDWAVYNLTTATCADIFTNPSIEVSCNYAPNLGCNGTTGPNNQTAGPCGLQNNPMIPVTPGQTYVINVSNYSSTQSGYTIDFTASTGSIFDVFPPFLLTTSSLTCGSSSLTLTFNENVTCNSVQATDFVLTGPGGPYMITAVNSAGCTSGADYSKVYTVTFSPAISVAGIYNFAIVNPVQDLCGNQISVPTNKSININGATVSAIHTDVSCFGDNDGSITLTPGGMGPFTYQWSPNVSSSNTATNITAGTYTVTVSPSNGACSALATVTVTEPPDLVLQNQNIISAVCGASNGSIATTISGGAAPYQYQWSPTGGAGSNAASLAPGNYTLTVTDNNNCDFTQAFIVPDNNSINASVNTIQNVSCKNGTDGEITLAVNGVSASASYLWSNGATTKDLLNIPAGSYTVTITDGNCQTTLSNLTIIEPLTSVMSSPLVTATTCGLNNGAITVNASGGTGALSYQWAPSGTGALSQNLPSGTYTITITDANGCTAKRTIAVAASTSPVASVNYINQMVSCYNGSNGNASISVNSGTAPYTYLWSSGMGTTNSNNTLSTGNYNVTVTDQAGCTTVATVSILNAPQLTLTVGTVQHVKCFGQNTGSATFNGSGGTGALTFLWSPAGGNSNTANNLIAGTYTVQLTDANGCTKNNSVTIQQPTAALNSSITPTATNCGLNNGALVTSATGGTAPYTYLWSNGSANANISNLASGTYTLTVTDANLCVKTKTTMIAASTAPIINVTNVQNLNCANANNGSIAINVTSGVQPYSYQWTNNVSNSNSASNLAAGSYVVTVTDNAGCVVSSSNNITSPVAIAIQTLSQQNVKCFGNNTGNINIAASGGTGTLSYLWSNGNTSSAITTVTSGNYTVTVTDQNNCTKQQSFTITQPASALTSATTPVSTSCGLNNGSALAVPAGGTTPYKFLWSNGSNSAQINNLASGNYTVTVSDFYNCSLTQSAIILPSTAVTIQNTQQANVDCNGGSNGTASITAAGGVAPYNYLWTGGQTTASVQNLTAGNYQVTVTDNAGCTVLNSFTITQPSALTVALPAAQTVCEMQASTVAALPSGGTSPYYFLWSNGQTNDTLFATPSANTIFTLTVTDNNGCTSVASATINVFPQLTLNTFNPYSVCQNTLLSFTANVSGGNGQYQYNWNNGASTQQTFTQTYASSTSVNITATDGCNYSTSAIIAVNVVPTPVVTFTADNTTGCIPLTVNVTDNSQSITGSVYNWNTSNGTLLQQGNNYQITYTTSGVYYPVLTISTPAPENCTTTFTYTDGINALDRPVADFSFSPEEPTMLNPEIDFKNQSQFATIYNWSFGDGTISTETNPINRYTTIGTYEVTLISSNTYCEDTISKTIEVTDQFSYYVPNSFSPNADGRNDVFASQGTNIVSERMAIYNRWGMKIFESSAFPFNWNGRMQNTGDELPRGIYVYTISITDKFGKGHSYNGTVTLIK